MNHKPQSRKEARERRRKENFVGRGEQLRKFEENLLDEAPLLILSVTGEGGVGKSTLLKQFENLAHKRNAIVITCDDEYTSPAAVMGRVAEELAKAKFAHSTFDERYKEYRKLRQEVEGDPKAPRGVIDLIARGVSDAAIKSARRVPGASPFLEHVDEKAAGETLSQFAHYAIDRWGNKDEVRLLREPERILTPLWLELMAKATASRRVLLLFDVFERTSASLASWLLALCGFDDYGDFDTNLSFVIAGREPLEQHWTELAGDICHMPLEPFTPEETRGYLLTRAIADEQLVAQIHEDTGGLPVLVELLAATNPQPGVPLRDVSKDAVERFLQWVEQEDRRRAALLAAVPRRFNRDILSAALGSDATATFNWLATQSFVRRNAEDGWFYHEKVRELMLRHLRNTTPKDADEAHARLADYFAKTQADLKLENREAYDSETWRQCECERVYHALNAQPDRNSGAVVNAFFLAFRWRWGFSERLAECCQQCGREKGSQTIRDLAEALAAIWRASDQHEFQPGIEKLNLLERRNDLTTTARCETHALRGDMYRLMGKYEEALADCTRAIGLDEKYAWIIAVRGESYRLMGKYEEALADFTRAIELDEKGAWAIESRGETYQEMGKYEEALADFTRAIELDETDAWAIMSRGETYWLMDKYKEALPDLTRAIELNEKDAWAISVRGDSYQEMGKYEEALDDFTRAIELDEKFVWAIASRGDTYRLMGKYEEALPDLTRAIELNEKDVRVIAVRGYTYQEVDKYEEALTDFTCAIALDEKYVWAIARRGETYRLMGKYEEALADFNSAIELDEKDVWANAQRGLTYRFMGKYEEALADYCNAIRLAPDDADSLVGLAACYRKLGQTAEYVQQIEIARPFLTEESEYSRACFAAIVGEVDEALALLGTALEKGEADIEWVKRDPDFDWIRDDPRFIALLEGAASHVSC